MFKRKSKTIQYDISDDVLIYHYRQTTREQRGIIDKQDNLLNQKNTLINEFVKELYSNLKTDKQKIDKLKELVNDYQSNH